MNLSDHASVSSFIIIITNILYNCLQFWRENQMYSVAIPTWTKLTHAHRVIVRDGLMPHQQLIH